MAKLLLGSVVGPQGPQGTPGVNGSQGPQGVPGPNEIAATTNVTGLTSGQLLYNNGGKVGSVEIVDNLLSVNPNKPLSANQGKVLKGLIDGNSSAIGQIANDRGYLNSKNVLLANIDTLVNNGKYMNISGMPVTGSWVVDVISLNATFVTQYASCIYDSIGLGYTGKKLVRDNLSGAWSAWKEIAFANEVLSLSGGNIVGNLNIGDTANSVLRILKAGDGLYSISAWKKNNPANDFLELILDGSISGDWSFKNAFSVRNAGSGALYKVYHEGNVTVSTSAPSSTLNNGCIHHVY